MIRETQLVAGAAISVIVAILAFALPAEAGTCSPVMGKGRAADPATATTRAQHELIQRAARLRRQDLAAVDQLQKDRRGFVCKVTAVVCPRKS